MTNNTCVFCKIIAGQAPASIVYRDDAVVALLPIDAVTDGHTLVIPAAHFENIFDITDEALQQVIVVAKKLSDEFVQKPGVTGINLLNANGTDAQQSVFHYHIHIVPRRKDDGLDLWIKQSL